ncbi:MAG: glycosyltransferase family 39 protein [Candidatus Alcyoniella australis]|nr:glycosyltransferase family 39 protein [Candidatus Alcyoniella australis]
MILTATVLFYRLPVLSESFCNPDLGTPAYAARLVGQGRCPYSEATVTKPPGSVLIFALGFKLFGPRLLPIYIFALLCAVGACLALYRIAEQALDRRSGLLAGGAYALYQAELMSGSICPNFESWAILPSLLSLMLLLNRRVGVWHLLGAGACVAVALWMKQVALLFVVAALLLALIRRDRSRTRPAALGLVLVGLAAGSLPFVIAMADLGCLGAMFEQLAPGRLSNYFAIGSASRGEFALAQLGRFLSSNFWLVCLAAVGLATSLFWPAWRAVGRARIGVWIYCVAALGATLAGGRFTSHYFVLLPPYLCLLGALTLGLLLRAAPRRLGAVLLALACLGLGLDNRPETRLAALSLNGVWSDGKPLTRRIFELNHAAQLEPQQVNEMLGHLEWQPTLRKVGRRLSAHLRSGETIWCYDYLPELYLFSGALSPTRFQENFDVVSGEEIAHPNYGHWQSAISPELQSNREQLLAQLAADPPRFIVRLAYDCPQEYDAPTAKPADWPRNAWGDPLALCQPRAALFDELESLLQRDYVAFDLPGNNVVEVFEHRPQIPYATRPRAQSEGWLIEPWLPPGELAAATDVAIDSDGALYAAEAWDTISRIKFGDRGARASNAVDDPSTPQVERLRAYSLEADPGGGLWAYNFVLGEIYRLRRSEAGNLTVETLAFDELTTTMESTLAVLSDGTLLVGVNRPGSRSELWRLGREDRTLKRLAQYDGTLKALVDDGGDAAICGLDRELYRCDPQTGELGPALCELPEPLSHNGLAMGLRGELYASTGDWQERGWLLRLVPQRDGLRVERIYRTPGPGIQGICLDGDALLGVSRLSGDLYRAPLERIDANADYRLIVGNGIAVPQMLAARRSGLGQRMLYVVDGESGRIMALSDPRNAPRELAREPLYNHIGSRMAIDGSGRLLFTVCAPGFESQHGLYRLDPGTYRPQRLALEPPDHEPARPCSAAVGLEGETLVADTKENGRILSLTPTGEAQVLVDRGQAPSLRFPTGLLVEPDGSLLVSVSLGDTPRLAGVPRCDTVLRLQRDAEGRWSEHSVFSGVGRPGPERQSRLVNDFVAGPEGTLYVATDEQLFAVSAPYEPGSERMIADGFGYALGLALDHDGGLLLSDGRNSAIWRLEHPELR